MKQYLHPNLIVTIIFRKIVFVKSEQMYFSSKKFATAPVWTLKISRISGTGMRPDNRYTDSRPNDINPNDIKPNDIKPNDI